MSLPVNPRPRNHRPPAPRNIIQKRKGKKSQSGRYYGCGKGFKRKLK